MKALMTMLIVACGGTTATGDGGTEGGGGIDGSTDPTPKVAISSAVGGSPTECRLSTVSSIMNPPGAGVLGIGNTNSLTIRDGESWLGGTVKVNCSVVPTGAAFTVSGRAELMGVTQGRVGTFTFSGVFHPRSSMMDSPNIMATLTTINGALAGTCTGAFDGMDQTGNRCTVGMTDASGNTICTQNNVMDVKSGAIWATVFCAMATDASQNPPRTCKTAATFRFENCKQM